METGHWNRVKFVWSSTQIIRHTISPHVFKSKKKKKWENLKNVNVFPYVLETQKEHENGKEIEGKN